MTQSTVPTRRRSETPGKPPLLLIGLVVLIVLFGVSLLWERRQLSKMESEQSPQATPTVVLLKSEEEYIAHMIPHHQEAVDSSRYLAERTSNEELKNFANAVVANQTKEIWNMIGLYQQSAGKQYGGSDHYMPMMPDLTKLSGAEMEKAYLRGMIDHHNAAIDMSKTIAAQSDKETIKKFAFNVVDVQTAEVEKLKGWLAKYP